jgi:hypothetical protein
MCDKEATQAVSVRLYNRINATEFIICGGSLDIGRGAGALHFLLVAALRTRSIVGRHPFCRTNSAMVTTRCFRVGFVLLCISASNNWSTWACGWQQSNRNLMGSDAVPTPQQPRHTKEDLQGVVTPPRVITVPDRKNSTRPPGNGTMTPASGGPMKTCPVRVTETLIKVSPEYKVEYGFELLVRADVPNKTDLLLQVLTGVDIAINSYLKRSFVCIAAMANRTRRRARYLQTNADPVVIDIVTLSNYTIPVRDCVVASNETLTLGGVCLPFKGAISAKVALSDNGTALDEGTVAVYVRNVLLVGFTFGSIDLNGTGLVKFAEYTPIPVAPPASGGSGNGTFDYPQGYPPRATNATSCPGSVVGNGSALTSARLAMLSSAVGLIVFGGIIAAIAFRRRGGARGICGTRRNKGLASALDPDDSDDDGTASRRAEAGPVSVFDASQEDFFATADSHSNSVTERIHNVADRMFTPPRSVQRHTGRENVVDAEDEATKLAARMLLESFHDPSFFREEIVVEDQRTALTCSPSSMSSTSSYRTRTPDTVQL